MKEQHELELFASLKIIENMRLEVIRKIVINREEMTEENSDALTQKQLSQARRGALDRIGLYTTRKTNGLVVSDFKGELEDLEENEFVFHQFSYYGTLPPYKDGYHHLIRQYYLTLHGDSFESFNPSLSIQGKAYVYIAHFFKNEKLRDLDNRNRKYLIDMLRQTPFLKDDSWKKLSIYEEGFEDTESHIQVFLLDRKHKNTFDSLIENHLDTIKIIPSISDITFSVVDSTAQKVKEKNYTSNQDFVPFADDF